MGKRTWLNGIGWWKAAGIALIAAAIVAYVGTQALYVSADDGHLFEGDGRERIDRAEWFAFNFVYLFGLLAAALAGIGLIIRVACSLVFSRRIPPNEPSSSES